LQNSARSNQPKTAVITGASSGIGRASALALSEAGFDLILCARDGSRLSELKSDIESNGGIAHTFKCDVSDIHQVKKFVEFASGLWSAVDVLFNNAGGGKVLSLEETTDEVWFNTVGTVLHGTFYCCREFLPLLKRSNRALIINNASVAAQRGFSGFAAYSAAKGGVASFSRSLREELRSSGIRVTTLSAGATDTPFWNDLAGEWDRNRMMNAGTVADIIKHIADLPTSAQVEELLIMPSGGAL